MQKQKNIPCLVIFYFAVLLFFNSASAQNKFSLDIRTGTLTDALLSLSHQTGIQVIIPDSIPTTIKPAQNLIGNYTVVEAMNQLLANTDYQHTIANKQVFIVSKITSTRQFQLPPLETFVVTGSYITNNSEAGIVPVDVVHNRQLKQRGSLNIADFVFNLPTNLSPEIQQNIFDQGFSAGTAQFNLRGLGLSSSLLLINGARQTTSGSFSHDGSTFADLNSLPTIMIERVEIVKDGASALYGSDAVSGVINIITKKNFEGIEASAQYTFTGNNDQHDTNLGILYGHRGNTWNIIWGNNYLKRSPLNADERSFTNGTGLSVAGQPGNFLFPNNNNQLLADPNCVTAGGTQKAEQAPCLFDFIPFGKLVLEETHLQSMLNISRDFYDGSMLDMDILYSIIDIPDITAPGTLPQPDFLVPEGHPQNPFNTNVIFRGRPLGANAPAQSGKRENETWRSTIKWQKPISTSWLSSWSAQYSENIYFYDYVDVLVSRFSEALQGRGGTNRDQFFNPFGLAQNGDDQLNDVTAKLSRETTTSLLTLDTLLVGDLYESPYGKTSLALGAQYRHETIDADYDELSEQFDFGYFVGGSDYNATRSIWSLFAELEWPITQQLELRSALRYEDYGSFGNTLNPKVSFRWEPYEKFSLRGAIGTAFRAPTLHQAFGFQTTVSEFIETNGNRRFRPDSTRGNPNLKNEDASTFSLGLIFKQNKHWLSTIDFWKVRYRDVITKQNAQNIFDADPFGAQVIRTDNLPDFNSILRIETQFINAAKIDAGGIDINFHYYQQSDRGLFDTKLSISRITNFDIRENNNSPTISALEQRNSRRFVRAIPAWRASGNFLWSYKTHELNASVNYVGKYQNDISNPSKKVDDHLILGLQYTRHLGSNWSTTFGIKNLFNRDPPFVDTPFGYDSTVHGPLNRQFYLRVNLHI